MKLENIIWWMKEEVIRSIYFGQLKILECMSEIPKGENHERKKWLMRE